MRSLDDVETLIAFFEARAGRCMGFAGRTGLTSNPGGPVRMFFRDQEIAVGDGHTRVFRW